MSGSVGGQQRGDDAGRSGAGVSAGDGLATRYRSDPVRTEERMRRYDEYMHANVLAAGGEFVCTSGSSCLRAARARNPQCSYYEGQLGYIGKHYDLSIDGTPFRVLFVGMELGGAIDPPARIDRAARTRHHDLAIPTGSLTRNQHMSGVILGLRYALGLGTADSPAAELIHLEGGPLEPVHVLDCYALMNARLCSATVTPRSRSSAGVSEMSCNCFAHLRAVVEILQPSLVVIQSRQVWRDLDSLWPGTDVSEPNVELRKVRAPVETLVAKFSHPRAESYPWQVPQDWYFQEVVRPTLFAAVQIVRANATKRR